MIVIPVQAYSYSMTGGVEYFAGQDARAGAHAQVQMDLLREDQPLPSQLLTVQGPLFQVTLL